MTARSPRESCRAHQHHRSRRPIVVATALAAGLTFGWLPTVSLAQQTPDGWSSDHRAVLRSGLTVDVDFEAAPGVTMGAATGSLGDAPGSGGQRTAPAYTDGLRPGAPAQTFQLTQDRPQTDGAWRTLGTLQLTFSRPVRNPRLHVSGLTGVTTGSTGRTAAAVRLSVTGGSPAGPALTARSPWNGWTVAAGALTPAGPDTAAASATASATGDAAADPAGSLELDGTFDTATFRVERRDTATTTGSTAPPPTLRQAYTVTLDEALGSAPQGYGNASHLISDLFLGADATGPTPGPAPGHRGTVPAPAPPELQPGRTDHVANDPTVSFPRDAAIGGYYELTVPVSPGPSAATLAGWIDFDRNQHFDAGERAQVDIAPGATTATLEWTIPPNVSAGDTWARLRIARDPSQVVAAGGFADAGEVEDQAVRLVVGAAKPELTSPVGGASVGDARPEFHGESGVAGATVQVQENTVTLCQARVATDGSWTCRPGADLAQGEHTVLPAETTSGGVVLHGDPVRITVITTPPAVPLFTLPAFSNDPGLLLTGTGGVGSTVSVTEAGGSGGSSGSVIELCRTAVRADRSWSCLPVEELAEGTHLLTATAVDLAGNHAAGKPTTLIVDTVPPAKPLITAPGPGEELHVVRPRLAGKGEPGVTVTVVSGGDGALCSAVAAVDGGWSCNAVRDLGPGDQLLTPTATDRAGNTTAGEAVRVHVTTPAVAPSASPSASPSPSPSPSLSSSPSPSPTRPASPSPTPSPSASPSLPLSSVAVPIPVPSTPAPQKSAGPTSPSAATPNPSSSATRQALPAPPDGVSGVPVRQTSLAGWHAVSCGFLLVLTGMTLITRRLLARGPGSRRR